jgi:phosphatidylserine decarboxylase
MVGVPMAAIFDYAMGTPSGHAAFLDPDVNRMLKKILNEWGKYLKVCFDLLLKHRLLEYAADHCSHRSQQKS